MCRQGIAFDGGFGITRALFFHDGGKQWKYAMLDKDYGKYSFRQWETSFKPSRKGSYELISMAINQIGQAQRDTPRWNPGGYLRNRLEAIHVQAV